MGNWISGLVGQVLAGQVRTALAVGGGVLLAHGADAEAVSNLQSCLAEPVVGLALWGITGLWSAKSKVTKADPAIKPLPDAFPEAPIIQYPK